MDVPGMLSASAQTAPKRNGPGKSVAFELLLDEGSKTRARIPLRVKVNRHDTTESIISTVKNFYGIYDGNGVSFADAKGDTLIASYDNLAHGDTVYVRSVPAAPTVASQPVLGLGQFAGAVGAVGAAHDDPGRGGGAHGSSLAEPFHPLPPHLREQSHSPSRSSSRLAGKRSSSPPQLRGRRSVSQHKSAYASISRASSASRSCSGKDNDIYSDSDAGRSSLSGSRKAKSEQIASSDISTANVLQDGRRGQTIFDSSTLPLFVPPQVPVAASQSSISPQRRSLPHDGPSPFRPPGQQLYDLSQTPVLSPVSHDRLAQATSADSTAPSHQPLAPPAPHGHHLRDRSGVLGTSPGAGASPGGAGSEGAAGHYRGRSTYPGRSSTVLPTPDPTVASCISDEDVARTLMALGDASNYSHGRTSTSTIDDTFSGAADAASSTGATSDSDVEDPHDPKWLDTSDEADIKHEYDDIQVPKTKKIKTKMYDGPGTMHRGPSAGSTSTAATASATATNARPTKLVKGRAQSVSKRAKAPAHTASYASGSGGSGSGSGAGGSNTQVGQPRKASSAASSTATVASSLNFQHQLAADEEDLSTKPRCQRCRKSKKGCDRQRPCQRCKDAGIGIEGCISEDEGNGRKGRFGRHMGVPVKKAAAMAAANKESSEGTMLPPATATGAGAATTAAAAAPTLGITSDKSKKRKR